MSVTKEVLKWCNLTKVNSEHPSNIEPISVTLEVLKLYKSIDIKELLANIEFILVTSLVLKLDKSTE